MATLHGIIFCIVEGGKDVPVNLDELVLNHFQVSQVAKKSSSKFFTLKNPTAI